jgi:3-oxoacyl-[acyl-carrier-protein] synthase III
MYTDPVTSAAVTIKQAVRHALDVLGRRGWQPEDIHSLILHQTSETTLDGAIKEVNHVLGKTVCTKDNTVSNLAQRGNTATTSHFVALWDRLGQERVAPGDKILFGISGSGQTVGSALYTMDDLPQRWRQSTTPEKIVVAGRPVAFRLERRVRIESIGQAQLPNPDTTALLRAAGSACMQQSQHAPAEIGLVLHAGVYRSEFLLEPALAAIAAGELGINEDEAKSAARRTLAFDISNGAVGPLDACLVASQLLAAGRIEAALVLASEVENNAAHWPQHLLGIQEAGSALILEQSDGAEGFSAFRFRSFVDYAHKAASCGALRDSHPILAANFDSDLEDCYLHCAAQAVNEFLTGEGCRREEIGLVLATLRSESFVRRLAAAVDIPCDRFVLPAPAARDAFTSSLAQGLAVARAEGRCVPGTTALIVAVGAGVQVGCALYHF